MPPVSGPTWPILTSWAAGAAGALDASAALASPLAAGLALFAAARKREGRGNERNASLFFMRILRGLRWTRQ